jgi:hypothetical protein
MPAYADPAGDGGYPNDDLDKAEGYASVHGDSVYGRPDAIRLNRK